MKTVIAIVLLGLAVVAKIDAAKTSSIKLPSVVCKVGWAFNVYNPLHYVLFKSWYVYGWNTLHCPIVMRPLMQHCDGVAGLKMTEEVQTRRTKVKKSRKRKTKGKNEETKEEQEEFVEEQVNMWSLTMEGDTVHKLVCYGRSGKAVKVAKATTETKPKSKKALTYDDGKSK